MRDRERSLETASACAVITLACLVVLWPLLSCQGACTLDVERWALGDAEMLELGKADVRLNTWILAWVQHALVHQPFDIFDANIFHPAPHSLAGSEHMLSVAALAAPARVLASSATVVYNVATALSFLIAGLSTYAFAAWLTRSSPIAAAMGVAAMLMPWRLSELGHLQLLFAAWLPLVWLLVARCLVEGAGARRLIALSVVWTALIFSSYYVAYFACFTTAAFVAAIVAVDRAALRRVVGVAAALGAPLVLLAVFSVPYLEARADADLVQTRNTMLALPPSLLWEALRPHRLLTRSESLPYHDGYSLPALLLIAACCSALPARSAHDSSPDASARRAVVAGLLAASVLAAVMALGQHVDLLGLRIPLPALWAARIVPGFDFIRAPLRWLLIPGVVLPLVAAVGLRALASHLGSVMAKNATVALVLLSIIVVAPLVPPQLPVAAAHAAGDQRLYDALADLPRGPVLEVPWPLRPEANVTTSSTYMVASTPAFWPLLNGYTAYKPRTYDFLVRAGARLPERTAVERLSALTGLRWIVVHLDALADGERDAWDAAQMHGPLAEAYRNENGVIYEVVDWQSGGTLRLRLTSRERFATTISGLPRTPLELEPDAGKLSAPLPIVINRFQDGWASQSVPVRIVNNSGAPWPAIDPDPNGLVHVRYSLRDGKGDVVLEGTGALDDDVPARGTLVTNVTVQGSLAPGTLRLRLDLLQLIDGRWHPIGVPAVEGEAKVVPLARTIAEHRAGETGTAGDQPFVRGSLRSSASKSG